MFVVIYRWRLKPDFEDQFGRDWRDATIEAREKYGSGGSSLFRAEDGTYVAIARWPDRESRERFFARRDRTPALSERMAAAIEETFPALELETVHDLWAPI